MILDLNINDAVLYIKNYCSYKIGANRLTKFKIANIGVAINREKTRIENNPPEQLKKRLADAKKTGNSKKIGIATTMLKRNNKEYIKNKIFELEKEKKALENEEEYLLNEWTLKDFSGNILIKRKLTKEQQKEAEEVGSLETTYIVDTKDTYTPLEILQPKVGIFYSTN